MAIDALAALLSAGTITSAGTTAAAKSIPLLSPIINQNVGLPIRLNGLLTASAANAVFSPVVQSSQDGTTWVTRASFTAITAVSGTVVVDQSVLAEAGDDPYLRFVCPVPSPTTGSPSFVVTVSPADARMA